VRTMWEIREVGCRRWVGSSDGVGAGSPAAAGSSEVDGVAMVVDQWWGSGGRSLGHRVERWGA